MEPAAVRSEPDVDDGTTRRASEAPASADGFRPDIDGLRAIAILLVVAYHAHVPGFTGGFVGVDVFFVISGYLITRILLRQTSAGSERRTSHRDRRPIVEILRPSAGPSA